MMNPQFVDWPFIITFSSVFVLTLIKDFYNAKAGKITDWEEFDKEGDVLTETERGFLERYRCNTMDIEDILHDFVCSGQFGEYTSDYGNDADEEEAEMAIYKKVEIADENGKKVTEKVELEEKELTQVFKNIISDGKFMCSICLEQLYDVELVEEALNQEEVQEKITETLNLQENLNSSNIVSEESKIEVRDQKELEADDCHSKKLSSSDLQSDLDSIVSLNIKNSQREVHKTPCSHYFHKSCLEAWCESRHNCPMCRKLIVTEFIYLNLD